MKKISLIIMAMMVMLFAQCKKTETITPEAPTSDKVVNISLNVGGGSKTDVNTLTGVITFDVGDKIYVACNGTYVGTLQYSGLSFIGTITNPTEGEYLHFYLLGGDRCTTTDLKAGTTTELTADISDQASKFPVISYGKSTETYSEDKMGYTTTLRNKCGLVKFTTIATPSENVYIKKMNNKVTVNLSNNTLEYSKMTDDGAIAMRKVSEGEYWALLLPQESVTGSTDGDAYSTDGWRGTFGEVPAVVPNGYYPDGVALPMVSVRFSVAENTTVEFSPANLYYDGSGFRFEENQWDFASGWSANHVSHFYYHTNAAKACAENYDGTDATTSDILFTNNQESGHDNEPNPNFTVNGETGIWRALKRWEWDYLINERQDAANRHKWIIFKDDNNNDVNGFVILPDGVNTDVMNSITKLSDLATYNAVFLPATGGTYNTVGNYWAATPVEIESNEIFAYCLQFHSLGQNVKTQYRENRCCIRLVK